MNVQWRRNDVSNCCEAGEGQDQRWVVDQVHADATEERQAVLHGKRLGVLNQVVGNYKEAIVLSATKPRCASRSKNRGSERMNRVSRCRVQIATTFGAHSEVECLRWMNTIARAQKHYMNVQIGYDVPEASVCAPEFILGKQWHVRCVVRFEVYINHVPACSSWA